MALELEKQLFTACKNGWLGVVKNLVNNRNVDLSCRDDDGNVPLHLACLYGHAAIVHFLTINKRCDAESRNHDGDTPINYAALKGHLSIVKLLVDDIRCHPTVNGRFGRTPLHDVCSQGHLHIVKYLIDEVGVDPLCQDDKTGATPLHLACQCGHSNIVRYLEKHIDDECRDNDGNTPLHYAALHGHLNIVQLLVDECHCDPMWKGPYGRTPLHHACEKGHLNVAMYLLDKQHVDASRVDSIEDNVTPLHMAAQQGHTEVVKYLVGVKKCDPAPRSRALSPRVIDGETPYDWARQHGHMDIALYLEGQGGGPSGAHSKPPQKAKGALPQFLSSLLGRGKQQEYRESSETTESVASRSASPFQQQATETYTRAEVEHLVSEATRRATERATDAERRAGELSEILEKALQEAEQRVQDLQTNAARLEAKAQESHQRVDEEQQRAQTAERRAQTAEQRTTEIQTRLETEVLEVNYRLREAETEVETANRRVQEAEQRAEEAQRRVQREQEQTFWAVERGEIMLTEETVGRGGWGVVKVAHFRGTRVAAKCLYSMIASDYNRRLFIREMNIAAKVRHPNLLQFIAATIQGELIILTELMPTSLRAVLERGPISHQQTISFSLDVARALNYLHLMRPRPIIHRDLSSGNVLLEPGPNNSWRAKVSDYGSANFLQQLTTKGPGNPNYAAPEADYPSQQSPKMDIFSFGVLLVEMCTDSFPDADSREELIQSITDPRMVRLIRECTAEERDRRPSAVEIMVRLSEL